MSTELARSPTLLFMLMIIPLTSLSVGADTSHRPGKDEFNSRRLEITYGGISARSGGKPGLVLRIQNKEGTALWVRVRFRPPKPNQGCDVTQKLEPKGNASYFCQQETIVADTDYPIQLTVFSDEALKTTVEETTTKFHFSRTEIQSISVALAPWPQKFDGIVYTEKPHSPAAALGAFKKSGTLTLGENGIEYVNKGHRVAVPYSAMRSAQLEQLGNLPEHVWLVIKYEASGDTSNIGFQPHSGKGDRDDLLKMHSAVTFAIREKGPIERVRIGFDGRQWLQGYRAETDQQTVTEFVLAGQTVERWTELVTVQSFPGLQTRMTSKQAMLKAKKKTLKDCPDAMWNVIAESKDEIVYEWRTIGCKGFDNQHEISKMISGAMAIHRLAYVNKNIPISDEQRTRWIGLITHGELELVKR